MVFYWAAPASDGGSPITKYTLASAALAFSVDISANVYTYTRSGLTDKVDYTFTLTATNAVGTSPVATFRTVQTGAAPYGPTTATLSTLNASTAYITWNISTIASQAAVRWVKIRGYPSTSGMSSFVWNTYPFKLADTRTGLSTNTYYQFSVQAGNDAGQSLPAVFTPTLLFSAAPVTGGSLLFDGSSAANLSIANDTDFRNGSGDFTIEWFQYATTPGNSFPRLFSIGSYSGQSIAVSQEGSDSSRTFYAWISSGQSIESADYRNTWIHFALCRSGTSFRVFKNGTQIGTTITNSTNFNDSTNALRIGNETAASSGAAFKGYITNFRWTKGQALYTTNFTRPAAPLSASANTSLLLLASSAGAATTDSSGKGKTVTNGGVTWSSLTPF